ncbi:MAG: pyruvate kinase alpha/beta domain-containing protein [Candidatus Bathyarchaeota archaeon]
MEKKIVYFEKAGIVNTEQTLKLAKERAKELDIKTIVLASNSGYTAKLALDIFKNTDLKLVIVCVSRQRFPSELLKTLVGRGIAVKFSNEVKYSLQEMMRNAFYKFSEGIKVVAELGMIVAEEGLVPENEEIVAIAGTGHSGFPEGGGADTAAVIKPKRSENFNKLPGNKEDRREIREIICKPR